MKYLVSVDIEGISGVIDGSFTSPKEINYSLGKNLMTHDTNAVVEGIFATDLQAQVVVRDAHGMANNLDICSLHPKAQLFSGWANHMNMVYPLDESFNAVYLVGYHAGGSNLYGALAHTFSSRIKSFKVNGQSFNEASIAALYAYAKFQTPVALLAGDDRAIKEGKESFLSLDAETALVKESYARDSILAYPLAQTHKILKEASMRATQKVLSLNSKWAPPRFVGLNEKGEFEGAFQGEVCFYGRGFYVTPFPYMKEIFSFDKAYEFDDEKECVLFKGKDPLELLSRFELLCRVLYGMKCS